MAFPSIRRLFLWYGAFPAAVELVRRCPNIEIVNLILYSDIYDNLRTIPSSSWPTLRSLCCDEFYPLHTLCCNEDVVDLKPATHLQIPGEVSVVDPEHEDKDNVRMLLDILGRVSPVWAELSMTVGGIPMRFWSDVPQIASRLQCLDLTVSLPRLKEEYAPWLVYIIHTKVL